MKKIMLYRKNSFIKTFVTRKRAIPITSKLSRRKIFVHNGKSIISVKITKGLESIQLGALSLRKELGKRILNFEKKKKHKNNKILKLNKNDYEHKHI